MRLLDLTNYVRSSLSYYTLSWLTTCDEFALRRCIRHAYAREDFLLNGRAFVRADLSNHLGPPLTTTMQGILLLFMAVPSCKRFVCSLTKIRFSVSCP